MIEQWYKIAFGNTRTIEKVIHDENLQYFHVILNKDEGLPEQYSNSIIYITILRGVLSITLNNQEVHEYTGGMVIKIEQGTKMNIMNSNKGILQFFLLKVPAP